VTVRPGCSSPAGDLDVVESAPLLNLSTATRESVCKYFDNTWNMYETLFRSLKDDETFYLIPDKLRRPLIFYLGHTAAVYANKLLLAKVLSERINPVFERLFETGVDEMSWDDMEDANFDWPSVADVWAFRKKVYEAVRNAILTFPYTLPITQDDPMWAVAMAFEHERIHYETSAVLIRQLPVNKVVRPPGWKYAPSNSVDGSYPRNEMVDVPGTTVTIGKRRDFPSFGWDNEYGSKVESVRSFKASKYLVSNGEFLEFVRAGGYTNQKYWDDEGWRWCQYRKALHPTFWVPQPQAHSEGNVVYKYRATFDVIDMPWDWPVDTNYHESKAFCRWKGEGYRVITEAEHHCMRNPKPEAAAAAGTGTPDTNSPSDIVFQKDISANLNMKWGSATPVDFYPPTHAGFYDVHGNVWEWTEDHFHPLPGFQIHPIYDDFSTPCFDNRHNMIMGGSWVSTGDEASIYARFHFRRHFFQNLGFRYVLGADPVQFSAPSTYESAKSLNEYLLFHYGRPDEVFPYTYNLSFAHDFPARLAHESMRIFREVRSSYDGDVSNCSALDIGCAVGRSSFELARLCTYVLGIDFSARFISTALRLQEKGRIPYMRIEEGLLETSSEATVAPEIDRSRVRFVQGDACNLPITIGSYDIVLAANLIDRLHHPMDFLKRLPELVKPDGLLYMTSPYTWLEEYTAQEQWLGGVVKNGVPKRTFEALSEILTSLGFSLVTQYDMPFIIREHSRKFQLSFAHATAWRRNAQATTSCSSSISSDSDGEHKSHTALLQ